MKHALNKDSELVSSDKVNLRTAALMPAVQRVVDTVNASSMYQ